MQLPKKVKLLPTQYLKHIEFAGVHSGDATIQFPPQKLYVETVRRLKKISRKIAEALKNQRTFQYSIYGQRE
jgi:carbamoyl-phosphate synthase large subunit